MAQKGYCSALTRGYCGVREHLIATPNGLFYFVLQLPGNRHDVNGLYALLETSFQGHLLSDNAFWPHRKMRPLLEQRGITITAATRRGTHFVHPPDIAQMIHRNRKNLDRLIGLFNQQFHADRTRCRSPKHYMARRWLKVLAHNISRHINAKQCLPFESVGHFNLAA